jgi:hypothetical protein
MLLLQIPSKAVCMARRAAPLMTWWTTHSAQQSMTRHSHFRQTKRSFVERAETAGTAMYGVEARHAWPSFRTRPTTHCLPVSNLCDTYCFAYPHSLLNNPLPFHPINMLDICRCISEAGTSDTATEVEHAPGWGEGLFNTRRTDSDPRLMSSCSACSVRAPATDPASRPPGIIVTTQRTIVQHMTSDSRSLELTAGRCTVTESNTGGLDPTRPHFRTTISGGPNRGNQNSAAGGVRGSDLGPPGDASTRG